MLFKIQNLNYLLIFLITLIALIGAAGLYSAAGGSYNPWASRHIIRFILLLILAISETYHRFCQLFAHEAPEIDYQLRIKLVNW